MSDGGRRERESASARHGEREEREKAALCRGCKMHQSMSGHRAALAQTNRLSLKTSTEVQMTWRGKRVGALEGSSAAGRACSSSQTEMHMCRLFNVST